jgi:phosphate starvation-inducible protein PhoH and related proteins
MNYKVYDDCLEMPSEQVLAICGPQDRHLALIEQKLSILIETPGSGFIFKGDARARGHARRAIMVLRDLHLGRVELGLKDVERAIAEARLGSELKSSFGAPVIEGRRGVIVARTQGQESYLQKLKQNDLVFGIGPAGSGKTFLAVAHGLSLLMRGLVEKIVITRPAVEAGEKLGFLPGDLNEKLDPYLAPIWQSLGDIIGPEALKRRRDKGEIEIIPLAYMRGRTLSRSFILVDEAQNTTSLQMKMLLTRLGEGSTMVVTGDPTQIDLPRPSDSGLNEAVLLLGRLKKVSVCQLTAKDIVRHELVSRIVKAYEQNSKRDVIKTTNTQPSPN